MRWVREFRSEAGRRTARPGQTRRGRKAVRIGVYAFDDAMMFHLAVPQIVFTTVARRGLGEWRTFLFSESAGSVRTGEGYTLGGVEGLRAAREADMLVVPSWYDDGRSLGADLREVLVRAHSRGVMVLGLCLGALALVEAGLLEGRPAITHWRAADRLAALAPGAGCAEPVLFIDHGDVLTSAGTGAGLDACLHVVRSRLGAQAAATVARDLVIAPHREGGQAQYVERPVPQRSGEDGMSRVMQWAVEHLSEPLPVVRLAEVAHMSPRTFVRAFRAATGATPAAWVKAQRLEQARRLLESTELAVDGVASQCGFGSPVTMRQAFTTALGTSPSAYRRRFRQVGE